MRRTPIKRVRKQTGVDQKTREVLLVRACERCERCGDRLNGLYSIHHRTPRGMGGTRQDVNTTSNLVVLCGSGVTGCHGWVEHNRKSARDAGLLVSRGTFTVDVPIITAWGASKYLDDEGGTRVSREAVDDK